MPKEISFGALVNSITPVNTIADRTLTFVYGPEHQRISQRVQLSSNAPSSMQAGQTWYLNGEDSQGLTYEKEAKTNGIIEHKHYLSAGGIVFAMHVSRTGNINNADPLKAAETLNYLHHDYLGSIVAISNEAGQVTERLAFDPWGKRRYPNGLPDANDNINGLTTERGFTMHEHLDEMGLIHMNGRIYDPLIGRFMSADPFIQAPGNLQSHNRYSYVMNNPLNLTDPSGYFSFKRLFRVAVIVAAAYFTGGAATQFFIGQGAFTVTATGFSLTTGASIAVGAAGGFAAGFAGAALSGGNLESALKGGLIGALSGGAFGAVGANSIAGSFGSYAGHAAVGCISAVAGGGACGSGAASALFGKFTTNAIGNSSFISGDFAKGVATAVAGGVGSVIAGGKFENGAITAAYGYLFNYLETTREKYESQPVVNSCAGELICKAGDVAGNGHAEAQYPGPNPIVKWGEYECGCSSEGTNHRFVGPGDYFDRSNLLGVDEVRGYQLNRQTGQYSKATISQTPRSFTVDMSSRLQRWWYQDFLKAFSMNNQSTPSR